MEYSKALRVLGLTQHPSEDELKKVYRKLSRQYHPDIVGDGQVEMFKEVTEAYKYLKEGAYEKETGGGIPKDFFGNNMFTHDSIFRVLYKTGT